MKNFDLKPLLTATEVAGYIGKSKSWVYQGVRLGHIPAVRVGRHYRFRRASIEAWILKNEWPKGEGRGDERPE